MYTVTSIEGIVIYLVVVHALVHFVIELRHVYRFVRRRLASTGTVRRGRVRTVLMMLIIVAVAGCVASAPAVFYSLEAIQQAH